MFKLEVEFGSSPPQCFIIVGICGKCQPKCQTLGWYLIVKRGVLEGCERRAQYNLNIISALQLEEINKTIIKKNDLQIRAMLQVLRIKKEVMM